VVLEVAARTDGVACPDRGVLSGAVHDRSVRRPLDLPWRGRLVRLRLTVRRCRCRAAACPGATFAERFGPRLPRRAQRSAGAAGLRLRFGWTAGGEAGARLAAAAEPDQAGATRPASPTHGALAAAPGSARRRPAQTGHRAAVDAAVTTAWSNGQTEGQLHRLKLIKRQGSGRATLDLLRSRLWAS
jgi:transposase